MSGHGDVIQCHHAIRLGWLESPGFSTRRTNDGRQGAQRYLGRKAADSSRCVATWQFTIRPAAKPLAGYQTAPCPIDIRCAGMAALLSLWLLIPTKSVGK